MDQDRDHEGPGDLSALAWVNDELRRTLETAHKSLRRQLRESDSRPLDFEGGAPTALLQARHLIHQGVGALDMIGLPAAARFLRASEQTVQRLSNGTLAVDHDVVATLERASFALLDYLRRMLAGQPVPALALFPQYRDVLALAGAERVHPADLWDAPPVRHAGAAVTGSRVAVVADTRVRGSIERKLLDYFRTGSPAAAGVMGERFHTLAQATAGELTLPWQLAAAFFEAQAQGLLATDLYTKRMASRLLALLRAAERGQTECPERLLQDLLFYCARARRDDDVAPRLGKVWDEHGLQAAHAVDVNAASLGRFDPALLPVARRRVGALKDTWSALTAGEYGAQTGLNEQAALVADSVRQLYSSGQTLATSLTAAVASCGDAAPSAPLAMEVATCLLCIDASLDEIDLEQPDMQRRIVRLAQRLDVVAAGRPSEPVEPWVEALYRDVSDRQAMGSVVQELRSSLAEVEAQMDRFSRNPEEHELLIPVPGQLSAMRGVMSVLGLDQATQALARMREDVDAAMTAPDQAQALAGRLADNVGALSFLIDMLGVQPQLAKSLFQFDAATGRFAAVMGRARTATAADAADAQLAEQVAGLMQTATDEDISSADLSRTLEDLSHQAMAADLPSLAETAAQARRAIEAADNDDEREMARADATQALNDFADAARPAPPPDSAHAPLDDDADMREIFFEEAREVFGQAAEAVQALQADDSDLGALTAVRRAFHTLKGSSRMVGLKAFGEGAWACEQLFNARLADAQARADAPTREFTAEALATMAGWVDALEVDADAAIRPDDLMARADALRKAPVFALESESQPELPPELDVVPEVPAAESVLDLDVAGFALPALTEGLEVQDNIETADLDASAFEAVPGRLSALDLPSLDLPSLDLGEAAAGEALEASAVESVDAVEEQPVEAVAEAPTAEAAAAPAESVTEAALPVLDALPTEAADEVAEPDALAAEASNEASDWAPTTEVVPPELRAPQIDVELDLDVDPVAEIPEGMSPDEVDAERYKVVGPLRISIALFNIYLNEADEQSRRLCVELSEWQLELDRPVSETALALAHSLAGNSAAVGYTALSGLARRLEHALERSRGRGVGEPAEAQLFLDAADEIRRLLHQFAAGFLKAVPEELTARFDEHEAQESQQVSHPAALTLVSNHAVEPEALQADDLPAEGDEQVLSSEEAGSDDLPSEHAEMQATQLGGLSYSALTEEAPVVAAPQLRRNVASLEGLGDDIDVADAIDPELFEFFKEEGQELLPTLAEHLRLWEQTPADMGSGVMVMRALHTLKGGARLAGAMRLGEMAHRLETAVEQVASRGHADAVLLARLQAGADTLVDEFDRLRRGEAVQDGSSAAPDALAALGQVLSQSAPLASDVMPALAAIPAALVTAADAHVAAPAEAASAPQAAVATAAVAPGTVVDRTPLDWSLLVGDGSTAATAAPAFTQDAGSGASVRVRGTLLDRLVSHAGEVGIARARIGSELGQMQLGLRDLTDNLERLRRQLRDLELQAETQMATRLEAARQSQQAFDPLEMDRFTRVQELTRMLAESVNDVGTVQRGLAQTLQASEDQLAVQTRLTRDLQDDLLRARMVEFDTLSDRLYRVVRQSAKDSGKQVRLNLSGGSIELDRSVLDRMAPAFEHLLRNAVAHGIEAPGLREATGKDAAGTIDVLLQQSGNEVQIEVRDDGGGLDLSRIAERARQMGLLDDDARPTEADLAGLIFTPGFSTADKVTELAGRGVGMDVVRAEVTGMGGRIETASGSGRGTSFKMVLPLTTAVTQVVPVMCGTQMTALPSTLIELVRRVPVAEVDQAYRTGALRHGDRDIPFFWLGSLLQQGLRGAVEGRTAQVLIVRSAAQYVAVHVGQVLGNQEVVVKNLGPQLSRLPGLAGMSLMPSGQTVLIYNPVALAAVYGQAVRDQLLAQLASGLPELPTDAQEATAPAEAVAPLVMVVDDSLTVRRVTQRLLVREGYRVVLAKDGLDALDRLSDERPAVMLCDIEMPRMDGFDLVRNLRNDPRLADLPVVMITSRIAQKHRDHATELGVQHYLGKPYDEDQLLMLVRDYAGAPVAV
ncbi:Hpt domain-containing protein [Ideonella margarita]|uniref:histidine kinase n=1 Tax=Ideonella margarita TaxID=2984191 RepID=A0ABU9C3E7_9BURK